MVSQQYFLRRDVNLKSCNSFLISCAKLTFFCYQHTNIKELVAVCDSLRNRGWSGGAKVLGKLPVPGRPIILIKVGQGPSALAVGAGGGCLDIFTLIYPFFSLSPSLWETARYRLK